MSVSPWPFDDPDDPMIPDSGDTVKMLVWYEEIEDRVSETLPLVAPDWVRVFEELLVWEDRLPFDGIYLVKFRLKYDIDDGELSFIGFHVVDFVNFPVPDYDQILKHEIADLRGGMAA